MVNRFLRVSSSSRKFTLFALLFAFCFFLSIGSAWAADKDEDDTGKKLFTSNCKYCHGADGAGTPVGQSMNAPDLRSEAVQKHTDAEMTNQIANGKGNMPPFKNSFSPDQIQSLVRYVRQLAATKPPAK
jgi:cytochrome c6